MNSQQTEFFKLNMQRAAMVLGVFSVIAMTIGFSVPFGAMGIIMNLLARGKDELSTRGKIGLGLSIFALVFGLASMISAAYAIYTDPDYLNNLMQMMGYSTYEALPA